jgi:hypothetical protein
MKSIQLIIIIIILALSGLNLDGQVMNDTLRITYKGKGVTVRPQGNESKTVIRFKDTATRKDIIVKVSSKDIGKDEYDEEEIEDAIEEAIDSSIKKTFNIAAGKKSSGERKHFIETHLLPNFDVGFTSTYNEVENDYAITPRFNKSANINLGIIKQDVNLYKNRLLLSYGFSLNNYHLKYSNELRQNIQYLDNQGHLTTYVDTINTIDKNRIDVLYLSVPVMLEYHSKGDKWIVMAGIEYSFGGHSKSVTKGINESNDYKHDTENDIKINPTQTNAILRIGTRHVALYGRYSISDMYKGSAYAANNNPHQHLFSVGICLLGI